MDYTTVHDGESQGNVRFGRRIPVVEKVVVANAKLTQGLTNARSGQDGPIIFFKHIVKNLNARSGSFQGQDGDVLTGIKEEGFKHSQPRNRLNGDQNIRRSLTFGEFHVRQGRIACGGLNG